MMAMVAAVKFTGGALGSRSGRPCSARPGQSCPGRHGWMDNLYAGARPGCQASHQHSRPGAVRGPRTQDAVATLAEDGWRFGADNPVPKV
jgi:hypothetical protein